MDFKKFDQGGGDEEVGNNQAEELAKIGNSVGVSAGAGAGAGAGSASAGTGGM